MPPSHREKCRLLQSTSYGDVPFFFSTTATVHRRVSLLAVALQQPWEIPPVHSLTTVARSHPNYEVTHSLRRALCGRYLYR